MSSRSNEIGSLLVEAEALGRAEEPIQCDLGELLPYPRRILRLDLLLHRVRAESHLVGGHG